MKKLLKAASAMMLLSTVSVVSCASLYNYIVPSLKDRPLRIARQAAVTEFRYYKACGFLKMKRCEVIENNFDLTKQEDRDKFNDMGFECSVPKH
jgi:hypothetical protein